MIRRIRKKLSISKVSSTYTNHSLRITIDQILYTFPYSFTGHCTGTEQYRFLKEIMENQLEYISADEDVYKRQDMPIIKMRMRRITENGVYYNIVPKGLYGDVSGDPHMRESENEDVYKRQGTNYPETKEDYRCDIYEVMLMSLWNDNMTATLNIPECFAAARDFFPAPGVLICRNHDKNFGICIKGGTNPVSYTHLDVYKRQTLYSFVYRICTVIQYHIR